MKYLTLLVILPLLVAMPLQAQDTTSFDTTYYMNDASVSFGMMSGWRVVEVEPRGSVIIADSTDTLRNYVSEAEDFQMSIFGPTYIEPTYGTDLDTALDGLVTDFFGELPLAAPQSITVNGMDAVQRDFIDGETAGVVVAFNTPDGRPVVATATTVVDGFKAQRDTLMAIIDSVDDQPLAELKTLTYTTDELGNSNTRYSFELPTTWETLEVGPVTLATNAPSVAEFSAAPGEYLLVVSPALQDELLMTDFTSLETNSLLDSSDPVTAAIRLLDTPTLTDAPDLGTDYEVTVANRFNSPVVALVRVIHAPGEAEDALPIALFVRSTLRAALPDGLVLADLPELDFTLGIDPDWYTTITEGPTLNVTAVPVDDFSRETDWGLIVSAARVRGASDAQVAQDYWLSFLERIEFSQARSQIGQLNTGQFFFRAIDESDPASPIRWGIVSRDGRHMFLITILAPAGEQEKIETMLEPSLVSLTMR